VFSFFCVFFLRLLARVLLLVFFPLLCCALAQGAAGLSLPEGVKLKEALAALVEEMGWADLAERTGKN
jgi:hypothetical protein